MCRECGSGIGSGPLICSSGCADSLSQQRNAIQSLVEYCNETRRASATYYFLSAALSAGGAVAARFFLPLPFLVWFAGGCAVVLTITGFRHLHFRGKNHPSISK
jgi:hypothetical protein